VATAADDDALDWHLLPVHARTVWRAEGLLALAPLVVSAVVLVVLDAGLAGAAAVALIGTAGLAALWWRVAGRRWESWGYAERERDLVLRRGVIVRRLTVVPYGRMQLVDVRQGPLARWLSLASVQLHTAAAASTAQIPLVAEDEARRLRERLTELGEAHAAGL
jgi:uncharacterized protein